MADLYKFYPDKDNPNYEKIKEDVITWLKEKGGMKESVLRGMDFNDLYDVFVSKQKESIYSKTVNEHFESSKYFIEKMLDKKEFDKFRKKFDDYHRFFPEKVFKVSAAEAYISYNDIDSHNPIIDRVYTGWEEDGYNLGTHLFRLLSHYRNMGGNCEFIGYYAYLQAKGVMEKYNMNSIVDDYKIYEASKYNNKWRKDLNQLKKAHSIYRNSSFYSSTSPYAKIFDKFQSVADEFESYIYLHFYTENEQPVLMEYGARSVSKALEKIADCFYNAEKNLANAITNEDIPMLRDQIKDYSKYYALYKGLGNFCCYSDINQEQIMELTEKSHNYASDYVVSSLGGKTQMNIDESQNVIQQLATLAERG